MELMIESLLWVGVWWVGFLGFGVVVFFIVVFIFGYFWQLLGFWCYVVMRVVEMYQLKDGSYGEVSNLDFGKIIRDLFFFIWFFLKNFMFILLCLVGVIEVIFIIGMFMFSFKFLEFQFSLSVLEVVILFGYLVVLVGGGGIFLGGFFVNKFRFWGFVVIKFCLFCIVVSLLGIFVFFLYCFGVFMVGVIVSYGGSFLFEGYLNLMVFCNIVCGCQLEYYSFVCGLDGFMYFLLCYVGCFVVIEMNVDGQKMCL